MVPLKPERKAQLDEYASIEWTKQAIKAPFTSGPAGLLMVGFLLLLVTLLGAGGALAVVASTVRSNSRQYTVPFAAVGVALALGVFKLSAPVFYKLHCVGRANRWIRVITWLSGLLSVPTAVVLGLFFLGKTIEMLFE